MLDLPCLLGTVIVVCVRSCTLHSLIRVYRTESDMADDTARRIDERRDHEGYPDALPARPNRGTAAHDRGSDNVRALLCPILACRLESTPWS